MMETNQKEVVDYQRAEHLLQLGRFTDAIPIIGTQLTQQPEDHYSHYQMARAFLGLSDYDAANQHADKVIAADPNSSLGFFIKSVICHYQLHFTQELEYAEQAAHLDPEDPDILLRLARAQIQSGLLKKAKVTAEQIVGLIPDDLESHEIMGDIYFELNDYEKASQHFEAALEYDPENHTIINDLARCYIGLKERKKAIETMHQALVLAPDSDVLRSNMYQTLQSFLDAEKLKGRSALKKLPSELQFFYRDYQQRTNVFEKFGSVFWGIVWISLFGALIFFFSTVT